MPKKRSLDVRLNEAEDRLDKLRLEKSIKELREKVRSKTRRR